MKSPKIIIFSIFAIEFLILSFTTHWAFIIGAVILMFLNQKELFKKSKTKNI